MKSFSAESRQYYPGNFDDSPPRLVLPPVAWTTHGPESLTFEECERLEEEEASYIRDAMLKERALHWRSQLGGRATS